MRKRLSVAMAGMVGAGPLAGVGPVGSFGPAVCRMGPPGGVGRIPVKS